MATLNPLLSPKSLLTEGAKETNLEFGRVWGFTSITHEYPT